MRSTKLYIILTYFSRIEQNRFRKYLESPYFNANDQLIQLYEILTDDINRGQVAPLEKEQVWKAFLPDKPFDDVRFRKYLSDLLKLLEGFLAQESFEETPLEKEIQLLHALGKKKLEKLIPTALRQANRILDKQQHRNSNYYHKLFQIESGIFRVQESEIKRGQKSNIEKISDSLDYFFIIEKLKYLCDVSSRMRIISMEYDIGFREEIVRYMERNKSVRIPAIDIYYQMYRTYQEEEDPRPYYQLKDLIGAHWELFPRSELLSIYQTAINYCIRKINRGDSEFLSELFENYREMIDKNVLFQQDGSISQWDFKNIIAVALRLGKYEWTREFIETYKSFLPDYARDNAVSFNLALLYWYQRKFERVIELLREVEYEDFSYNLNSKSILLQTYYEMDEIEPLYSLMDSFRAYLNRHKEFPLNRRKNFLNLIRFTKKLLKVNPGDQAELKKLRMEVDQTSNLASASWLKEKIAELA